MEGIKLQTPLQQSIYDYIRRHPGCSMEQIRDYVYRNDPNGGPLSNSVQVLIWRMRKALAPQGLTIISHPGRGATYRLIELKDSQ